MESPGIARLRRFRLLDWTVAALLAAIIGIILLQVFFRYVLDNALGWAEELSTLLFVWLVFLGTAAALRDRCHIRVTALLERLPKRVQTAADVFSGVLEVSFLIGLCWLGFRMVAVMAGTRSPALRIPVSLQYAALPVACALGVTYVVWHAVRQLRAHRRDEEEGDA